MKRLSLSTPYDFLAVLVRRKWWILVPFVALSLAIGLLVFLLPRMYVSESLIVIQQRGVPKDFVKDLIAGTAEQRISAVEKTVLSRTNLEQILEENKDRFPEFQGLNMDRKISRLRRYIAVSFEAERRMGVSVPLSYFRISVQDPNPELAQKIAAKITSLFIAQDKLAREAKVSGTTEFLSSEVEKVEAELVASASRLKELKQARRYELPDQLETNLRTLDRLNLQKQTNAEALDRYATLRLNLERSVSETAPFIPQEAPLVRGTQSKAINPLLDDYRKKEIEYRQLKTRYTEKHPDVQRVHAELERMRRDLPPEELVQVAQQDSAEVPPVMVPNPVYQRLVGQLREVKTEFEIREKEKKWIESEIEKYSLRVQNAPAREQEIAAFLRANSELNKQYQDLKEMLAQAELAESLESGEKGSPFLVVDPANYPMMPTKPNKTALVLGGMVFSLGVGMALAFCVDFLNQRIWTQSEIVQLLQTPVLVEIPEIVTDADLSLTRKRRLTGAAIALVCSSVYLVALYCVYLWQVPVLQTLDPIIRRVMN